MGVVCYLGGSSHTNCHVISCWTGRTGSHSNPTLTVGLVNSSCFVETTSYQLQTFFQSDFFCFVFVLSPTPVFCCLLSGVTFVPSAWVWNTDLRVWTNNNLNRMHSNHTHAHAVPSLLVHLSSWSCSALFPLFSTFLLLACSSVSALTTQVVSKWITSPANHGLIFFIQSKHVLQIY